MERLRIGYRPMVDPRESEKAVVYGHVSARTPGAWREAFAESGLVLRSARAVSFAAPSLAFTHHPWLMALLRGADATLDHLPGASGLCSGVCYVAVKPL